MHIQGWRRLAAAVVLVGGLAGRANGQEPATPTAAPERTGRVDLNLNEIPLGDVLRYFAEEHNLNIIVPPPPHSEKKVTLRLNDVAVMEALDAIVKAHDLAIVREGSILRILTRAEAAPRTREIPLGGTDTAAIPLITQSEIRLFDIRHARGEDLAKLLEGLITPRVGYVAYDTARQKLLVRDLPETLAKIAVVVEQVDVPASTVVEGTAQLPPAIKVVRLRFVETTAIRKALDKVSKAENVEVEEEVTTKSFVLRGFPERIAAVERMIHTLDQRTQQVRIRVRIVETSLGNSERLGVNWTVRLRANGSSRPWSFPFEAHTVDSWTFYPTPNPTASVGTGGGGGAGQQQLAGFAPGDSMPQVLSSNFVFGVLDATQFSALIEAIATDTSSNLVASPQLTTLDNKRAEINLGTVVPVPIFSNIINAQTNTVFPTVTGFENIQTGTTLRVTPRVGADDYITLDVVPEISEIIGFVGQNQERPIRSQRRMETTVVLKSGATLALGGLNQTKKTETVNKVPLLGDIPLLGRLLFTHVNEEITKTDLLIFITPELVREEEQPGERIAEPQVLDRGLVKVDDRWVSAAQLDAVNRVGKRLTSTLREERLGAVIEVATLLDAERSGLIRRADVLTSVLKIDTDLEVKRAAAESLGAVDPARLAAELATLPGNTPMQAVGDILVPMAMRTPSRSVRQLILANAIKVDRASTVTALTAAVAFGKPFERIVGADGLALAGDPAPDVITVLVDAIKEGKPGLSEAAADAIGACGGPTAIAALAEALAQRPAAHVEFHLAAALAEAAGDDARMARELTARGVQLAPRTRELLALERRERRARFDRVIKTYASVEQRDGPEVTGLPDHAARVRDALRLLAEGSPGHRHLVAVVLRGIDVVSVGAKDAQGRTIPVIDRVETGRLKLSSTTVENTPMLHLAHDLVYHAAVLDLTALPLDVKPAVGAGAGPIGHRVEEPALREQYLAIQAMAGRTDFREVTGVDDSIDEALRARGLSTEERR